MAKDKKSVPAEVQKAAADSKAADVAAGLVQLEYQGDNIHIVAMGVELHPGLNHLRKANWAEAKKQPSIQAMLASGDLVCPDDESELPPQP